MSKDAFANPFTLSSNDRRQLNRFFDDDDGYEQVEAAEEEGDDGSANDDRVDEDYEYGNGRPRRQRNGRRRPRDETLGDLMPNVFNSNRSSSLNSVYLGVLLFLLIFLAGYYGLSKKESERIKQAGQVGAALEGDGQQGALEDDIFVAVPVEDGAGNDEQEGEGDGDGEWEVGPALIYDETNNPNKGPLFQFNSQPGGFDPFSIQATKIKEQNEFPGAPFLVSPPQLPLAAAEEAANDDGSGKSRLGYFQYPTIVNGTLVFSTEGDLYLTRLPPNMEKSNIPPMPAMKLTTTVGNALHPKLNPKYPHLLAYSATYSGTREVYLMDLRQTSSTSGVHQGAPGTPGGPALRLTYTPGGIRSVVGWDEDGASILYSAMSTDVSSLPDVRLFRLRLSWGSAASDESESSPTKTGRNKDVKKDSDGEEPSQQAAENIDSKTDDVKHKENASDQSGDDDDDDDDDDYTIAGAQSYVDKIAPADDATTEIGQTKGDGDSSKGKGEHKQTAKKGGKKGEKGTRQRNLAKEERQRRHFARLSSLATRTRGRRLPVQNPSVHSIIEPIPLAQATEGVYHMEAPDSSGCIYFTRFKQSSSTKRYVGGTAESLWAYCPDRFDDLAIPLTPEYNGTSKSPSVYTHGGKGDVLFFMSDRAPAPKSGGSKKSGDETEWVASSMDLWAAELPLLASGSLGALSRLTNVACEFAGLDLSEYAIDPITGGIILRIGADLHFLSSESIRSKLLQSGEEPSSVQVLPIAVYSDFSNLQERLIPVQIPAHVTNVDAYSTSYGTVSTLITARGQTFVAPVIASTKSILETSYGGGGRNMPARRYKVAPGTGGGGLVRILSAKHVPQPSVTSAPIDSGERLALVLATDPLSPTGQHAFYLIRTDAAASPAFGFAALYEYGDIVQTTGLPAPFLGGHLVSGGSTRDGGLGSVYPDSITVSPCGRRFTFTDTDGRIVVATIPSKSAKTEEGGNLMVDVVILPQQNEVGQPLVGDSETELEYSPGGRYLAITHTTRNQFKVISIADLGAPENGSIELGRIVQATTDRFNSFSPSWGHASKDFVIEATTSALDPSKSSAGSGATALIFLSDRDVKLTGKTSPWGTRAPSPSFDGYSCVHILPLQSLEDAVAQNAINEFIQAPYGGGGVAEVSMKGVQELELLLELMKKQASGAAAEDASPNTDDSKETETQQASASNETNSTAAADTTQPFVVDNEISFGLERDESFTFARSSYRVDHIPAGPYVEIVCQLIDDPSLLLLKKAPEGFSLSLFAIEDWPSDGTEEVPTPAEQVLQFVDTSSDGKLILTIVSNKVKVTRRTAKAVVAYFTDSELATNIADSSGLHLNVWPQLEFNQMYSDAWRMLRDYFYDPDMHSVDWDEVFERYLPLVERCSKREELDDVLRQMIGELSALHSFVYGGEYSSPHHGDAALEAVNDVASLGAVLQRSIEKRGYIVIDIPERDPDFHMRDGVPMYSPLSNQVLKLSGQAGLMPGDVIVAVNGENVMDVPDIHMLLRNMAGESVRLDVLRIESTSRTRELEKVKARLLQNDSTIESKGLRPEPLIVVPMKAEKSADLVYAAWEWKTRELAKSLSQAAGFSCGYIHLQSMSGAPAMDSFVRGFYEDFDKEALIVDVRNNRGGNIDSWLLDVLQRHAWSYWESRSTNITTGGLGWDMQFAFRGHVVVLINEHTSSDGEGFARGVSSLGLGKLVGTRTWGGGIWLSSDNHLVDGGIASAPEVGTYNDEFGWGLGIEQMGVTPDVEVDNNPKAAYEGEDAQLEKAISVLKEWLKQEPVALPKRPGPRKDMSKKVGTDGCSA